MIEKDQTRKNIAAAVKRLMDEQGVTQVALSEASGVHQPRISLMLKGGILVNPCDLANIAESLGCTADDLIHNRRLAKAI